MLATPTTRLRCESWMPKRSNTSPMVIPKVKAKTMMIRYGHNVDSRIHDEYTASYQEQATEEEADLIPPAIPERTTAASFLRSLVRRANDQRSYSNPGGQCRESMSA